MHGETVFHLMRHLLTFSFWWPYFSVFFPHIFLTILTFNSSIPPAGVYSFYCYILVVLFLSLFFFFFNLFVFGYIPQTRQPASFVTELKQKLLLSPSDAASAGTRYNVPLINSLVLYVGMQVL
jgi:hypothetical protein